MRTFFLLVVFIGWTVNGFAQKAELDSLLSQLSRHPDDDTIRLNLLTDISFSYATLDPAKGLEAAEQAVTLAGKMRLSKKVATAFSRKGLNYMYMGENDQALEMFGNALSIYRQTGDSSAQMKVYHNLGIVHFNMADYTAALEDQLKALAIANAVKDSFARAGMLNSVGAVYYRQSDYARALTYYLDALKMFEQMGRLQQEAQTLGNIGLIYEHTNDLDKAASFFQQSIKIFEAAGNQSGMAEAYNNLANLYQDKDRQDSALVFYYKSAELNHIIGNKKGLANAFTNMGLTYLDLKKYDSSYFYFTRALAFYQEMGDKYGLASAYNGLGRVYSEGTKADLQNAGIKESNVYGLALENQKKALSLAKEIGEIDVQSEIWKSLSETYEKQKDYVHALAAYKSYVGLKDSIINDEKKTFLTQKQLQYEYDKKTAIDRMANDQEIALVQAGARQQKIVKNFVIAIALIAILFAVAILIIYKHRRDEAEQKHDAEFRAKVAETEMKALRAQMNPHFIFNSLNSIGDYISQHDHKSANDYLARFAKVMRMILENSEQKLVSLADDLKALELYMQLEAMRLQNKFRYDILVEEGIDPENILIPPLILQPFVENSIWHGLMKKNGNGRILVSVQKDSDMLLCIVEDNGIGREKSDTFKTEVKKIEKQSLGMKITNSRIDILNKVNRSNAEITLTDLDEGMRAEVRLPLQLSF